MAGWSDWYSGDMAPPMKTPGGYAPAPSMPTPMSVEEMYRGIYGPSAPGLTTRTVQTVPPPISVVTAVGAGLGTGMRGAGDVTYRAPKVEIPNPVYGPDPVPKYQDRLPAIPAGLPLNGFDAPTVRGLPGAGGAGSGKLSPLQGNATAKPYLGAGGFGAGTLTPQMPSPKVIQLDFDPLSDVAGQNTANSSGKPVRYKSGQTFYPTTEHTAKIRPTMGTAAPGAAPSGGGLFGGGGKMGLLGLLGMLTGGGQAGGGGLLGGLLGGGGPGSGAPGWSNPNISYNDYRYTPGEATTSGGNDMAFMPTAVQESTRWQTGY